MTYGMKHIDKEHGVEITVKQGKDIIHSIHTITPARKYIKGNDIEKKFPHGYRRTVVDFLLSKIEVTSKVIVTIKVFLESRDFESLIDESDSDGRLTEIDKIHLLNYDESDSMWKELTIIEKGYFTEPIKFNGTEYYGYLSAEIDVSDDPPVAIGR